MRPRALCLAVLFLGLLCPVLACAASLVMDGRMESQVGYTLTYRVTGCSAVRMLALGVVEPRPYLSLTTGQDVLAFSLRFAPLPDERTRRTDNRGNTILTATWNNPPDTVTLTYELSAATRTVLQEIRSLASFPPERPPLDIRVYQEPSTQVQSRSGEITKLATQLTRDATSSWEAVRQCIAWIVDNIRYVPDTARYDALSTLSQRQGNCQNFSHLAAALLRSVGLPVRIVNGITLDRPYDVQTTGLTITSKMALGRHSWIEVWFPDLGWAPFDPQNSLLFVPNRYLRCEVGVDNLDTDQDGRMAWIQRVPSAPAPLLREEHAATFAKDEVHLTGQFFDLGSRNLLRQPRIGMLLASLPPSREPTLAVPAPELPGPSSPQVSQPTPAKVPAPAAPAPSSTPPPSSRIPVPAPRNPQPAKFGKQPSPTAPGSPKPSRTAEVAGSPKALRFTRPYLAGNLDFPQDLDFTRTRHVRRTGTDSYQSSRSFLVESAQYVTTNLTQYAQLFPLSEPLRLRSVGLALHRYGGGGQLWLELHADDHGRPGKLLATSDIQDLATLPLRPGYRWVDFPFPRTAPQLAPGDHWLVLGFTGDAVVNWFYTYGKPVGPAYGTRYKSALAREWSGALSYEFNYRVQGLAAER